MIAMSFFYKSKSARTRSNLRTQNTEVYIRASFSFVTPLYMETNFLLNFALSNFSCLQKRKIVMKTGQITIIVRMVMVAIVLILSSTSSNAPVMARKKTQL